MSTRRYTSAELDAYELRPINDEATGERLGYHVLVGGDLLGRIEPSIRPRGWQAYTAASTAPVRHVGAGRVAATRQAAVVDLLVALDVHAT